MNKGSSRVLAIDFDDTIMRPDPNDPSQMGEPEDGAVEAIQELHKRGWSIVIFTCRMLPAWRKQEEPLVTRWLHDHEIPFAMLTATKPVAAAYIDNRAINYAGDWPSILKSLPSDPLALTSLHSTHNMASRIAVGPMRIIQAINEDFDTIGSFTLEPSREKDKDGYTTVTIKVKCR